MNTRCSKTRKVRHATREGATLVARKMKNTQLNAYQCADCKGWHVGNSRDPSRINQRLDKLLGRKPFRLPR